VKAYCFISVYRNEKSHNQFLHRAFKERRLTDRSRYFTEILGPSSFFFPHPPVVDTLIARLNSTGTPYVSAFCGYSTRPSRQTPQRRIIGTRSGKLLSTVIICENLFARLFASMLLSCLAHRSMDRAALCVAETSFVGTVVDLPRSSS